VVNKGMFSIITKLLGDVLIHFIDCLTVQFELSSTYECF